MASAWARLIAGSGRHAPRVKRTHRGTNAARNTCHNYSWHNTAGRIAAAYRRAVLRRPPELCAPIVGGTMGARRSRIDGGRTASPVKNGMKWRVCRGATTVTSPVKPMVKRPLLQGRKGSCPPSGAKPPYHRRCTGLEAGMWLRQCLRQPSWSTMVRIFNSTPPRRECRRADGAGQVV